VPSTTPSATALASQAADYSGERTGSMEEEGKGRKVVREKGEK
jgi:hypothetical protein